MPQIEKYPAHAVDTYTAEGAITQWACVTIGTADPQVKLPTAADLGGLGFAMAAAATTEQVQIAGPGCCSRAIASAAIAAGDYLAIAGTTGKVKTVTTADTFIVGRALTAAAADGDTVWVRVMDVNNT